MIPLTPDNFNKGLQKQKKSGKSFRLRNFPLLIVERIGGVSQLGIPQNSNTCSSQLGLENELKTPPSLFIKPE